MRRKTRRHVPMIALLLLGIGLVAPGSGWAQQVASPAPGVGDDSPALTAMAGVAGAIGSLFYLPFKMAAICPGMALASGASLAVTGGDRATAAYLLRIGCTGSHFITPRMVRGQEEFQGSGAR